MHPRDPRKHAGVEDGFGLRALKGSGTVVFPGLGFGLWRFSVWGLRFCPAVGGLF